MPLRALFCEQSVTSTLADEAQWVELKAAAKGNPDALILPGCRLPCYPRRSARGLKHFVHRPGVVCVDHKGESAIHMEAKAIIAAAAIEAGWEADVEQRGEKWIADVLAWRAHVRIAVEVQWSRQTLERFIERQETYASADVRGVWFARHSPAPRYPGGRDWPTRNLPVFTLTADFEVDTGVTTLPLADAVLALLGGHVQFRDRLGRSGANAEGTVALWQVPCYKCGQLSAVWTVEGNDIEGACGRVSSFEPEHSRTMWSMKRVEANPRIIDVATRLVRESGAVAAVLAPRRTRPVPAGYIAFTCGHCRTVFGDFPLRQTLSVLAYEPPLAQGTVVLDQLALVEDSPHWCWDRGEGLCPV